MTPRALDPFLAFPRALRAEGFLAAPAQTESFLAAVGLLGPRSIQDVRRAAHAIFGPGPDRRQAFDDLFDMIFLGRAVLAPGEAATDEAPQAYDAGEMDELPPPDEMEDPSGSEASRRERLFAPHLRRPPTSAALLAAFARALPRTLPRRTVTTASPTKGGGRLADPTPRLPRGMARRDGERGPADPSPAQRQRSVSGAARCLRHHEGRHGGLYLASRMPSSGPTEQAEVFTSARG
jgi:hypothetical protein